MTTTITPPSLQRDDAFFAILLSLDEQFTSHHDSDKLSNYSLY